MAEALRVAIIGAGPAGIYAASILTQNDSDATVDLYDRLPTPYGLIRYGVAPDHPRIRQIITALHQVLASDRIRFIGNVHVGNDLKIDELRDYYDAIMLATGAEVDRDLGIPGEDLHRSYGAAAFVSFYNAHPDRPVKWDLSDARSVAVIGAGNVGLDTARMLARSAAELRRTDVPEHVEKVWAKSAVTDVHLFARRGPAQAKFTPVELRELDQSPDVQVLVDPQGMEFDEQSERDLRDSRSLRMVVDVLSDWAVREPRPGPGRRVHLHFLQNPVEIHGSDGAVCGLRTERQELTGDGGVRGAGQMTDWSVQAVYRAVGYRSESIEDLPFDPMTFTLPNDGGRVLDLDGRPLAAIYTTGWVKRGPIGLIGHTKSDAAETVAKLLADACGLQRAAHPTRSAVDGLLRAKGLAITDFDGWNRLDAHERSLGSDAGRDRVKVATRDQMTEIAARPMDCG
ncbi:MAG TPA: FAD-dependent oxidoreductase [Mycobacterium sp.]